MCFIHIPYTVISVLSVYSFSDVYMMVSHPFTGSGEDIGHGSSPCQVLFYCIFLYYSMMLISYQGDCNCVFLSKLCFYLYILIHFCLQYCFLKNEASIFAKFLPIDLLTFEH